MLKVVREDADLNTATGASLYGSAYQDIEVLEALPDLMIESFQVGQPEVKKEYGMDYVYFPFTLKIKNIGGATADRFAIGITCNDHGIQVTEAGTTPAPLPRDQSVVLNGKARTHQPSATDVFRLSAKADVPTREFIGDTGHIRELNENNNLSQVVEVRFSYLTIIDSSYRGYRGGQIEILGSIGNSADNKKVVLRKGDINKAFCDITSFSPNKLTIKIPKTESLNKGEIYDLSVVDDQGRGLSNTAKLYICNPFVIKQVKIHESNYPGALINQRYAIMELEKEASCKRISWALARSLSQTDTDVITENITSSSSHLFKPNYPFSANEYSKYIFVRARDACLVAFDNDCEGVSSVRVPIYNLFEEYLGIGLIHLLVPQFEIHIDSSNSYLRIYYYDPTTSSTKQTWEKSLNQDPYNLTREEHYPTYGCDLKFWFRDINARPRLENVLSISDGVVHLRIPFETGGPDEIGVGYWSPECIGEVPDINLSKLELNFNIDLKTTWPINMDTFAKFTIGKIDIAADLNNVPDFLEKAFVGDLGGMIEEKIRTRLRNAIYDNRQSIFETYMESVTSYLAYKKGVPKNSIYLMQVKAHGNDGVDILYYVAR